MKEKIHLVGEFTYMVDYFGTVNIYLDESGRWSVSCASAALGASMQEKAAFESEWRHTLQKSAAGQG
jgi:hypothetical protein